MSTPPTCIIFGSNEQGFHGAGAAGYAMRGTFENTWRTDPRFQEARFGPDKRGLHAVFGQGRGFQTGTKGSSYAIATVTQPGLPRSVSLSEIQRQVDECERFIIAHPEMDFVVTGFGAGYAGYSEDEVRPMWCQLLSHNNVRWIKLGMIPKVQ